MKRWPSVLIVACVLLTASLVNAENKPTTPDKAPYDRSLDISCFLKEATYVYFKGDDARKIGLDATALTDYLRLKVKDNFADIGFAKRGTTVNEMGYIETRVWVIGNSDTIAFHIKAGFSSFYTINDTTKIEEVTMEERLGYGSRNNVPDGIKTTIGEMVEKLAIKFYKVREEL